MPQETYNNIRIYKETVTLGNASSVDSQTLPVKNIANIGIGVTPSGFTTADTLSVDLIAQLEENGEWFVIESKVVPDNSAAELAYGATDLKAIPAVAYRLRLTVGADQTAQTADIVVNVEYPH